MLIVASLTNPGSVRSINEDFAMWEPDIAMLAVADGMGGHNAGEIAAKLSLDTIRAFLKKTATSDDFTWPYGVLPSLSFMANRLRTSIKIANRLVFRASEERSEYTGMGTTVVAAIFDGARLAFAGVGDSRIYSFDGTALQPLTLDDSFVVLLARESGLDPSAFQNHPMRHVLTSVVGAKAELDVRVEEIDLVDGQTIVLCTDGVHDALTDEDIAAVLRVEPNLERAAETLLEHAVQRDGNDNATVALARYHGMP